jgi:protein YIPF6
VCTLGYSLVPMNGAALFISIGSDYFPYWVNIAVTALAFVWSVKSAALYIAPMMDDDSRGLALYPVILFYLFLALFIMHMSVE